MIAQRQLLTQRGETSSRSPSSGSYRGIDVINGELLPESAGNSTRTRETCNSRAFMESDPKQESLTTGPMAIRRLASWLEQIDPGVHRRIKGLRLVTAYGIAALLGAGLNRSYEITGGASLTCSSSEPMRQLAASGKLRIRILSRPLMMVCCAPDCTEGAPRW